MKRNLLFGVIIAAAWVGLALAGWAETKTLKVAAVQTANLDNNYAAARAKAERMVIEAAQGGAQLIVLPEFALIGYRFAPDSWLLAEPLEGPTVQWMRGLCRTYRIYLATCILEVKGDDFYDTMVLVGPGEGELWAHRKIEPAMYEAYFFKGGGVNPAVFETPLGRIGLAICMDTSKCHTVRNLLAERPDIVLAAFSAPETPIVPAGMRKMNAEQQVGAAAEYAKVLGAPVVYCNKTGPWDTPVPGLPLRLRSDFVARSRIVDAQGNLKAALEKEEAVIAAEVELGAGTPLGPEAIPDGRWFLPYNGTVRVFADAVLRRGEANYERNDARKAAVEAAKARAERDGATP